jgi:hypothetical protein
MAPYAWIRNPYLGNLVTTLKQHFNNKRPLCAAVQVPGSINNFLRGYQGGGARCILPSMCCTLCLV